MVNRQKGIITTYVLAFGAIFLLLLGGLLSFILLQLKQAAQREAWNEALHVAEAGIDYYQWCLNNEVEEDCQLEKDYTDAAGKVIGRFSLEVTPTVYCGEVVERVVVSTGWKSKSPEVKRKISVFSGKPSVARYVYLINNNVWAGEDREIRGLYHSNGGIRMDGENQSLVTSAAVGGEWVCTDTFGCSPCPISSGCRYSGSDCVCPGVFTTTGNSSPDLFSFPVVSFDFDSIKVDLASMQALTSGGQGLYFPPSDGEGYHVVLNEDRTIDVWEVTEVDMLDDVCTISGFKVICDDDTCKPECPECSFGKCVVEDPVIADETLYDVGHYTIPEDCGVVFFEDDVWIGGEAQESKIKGKITLVSADLTTPGLETDIWLQGNIENTVDDGSDGFTAIAQHDNLVGLYSPDNMEIDGIFIAQSGHFGRNYYPCDWRSPYRPHCLREKLEITGSVVSNGRVGTKWGDGASGFLNRENYFAPYLIYSPPPFTPYLSSTFEEVFWEEME
jgi:hypothetical protein